MQRPREELDRLGDPRPGDDRALIGDEVDAAAADRGHRAQRLPDRRLPRPRLRRDLLPAQIENHVRTPRQDQLRRRLHRLALQVREDVRSARRLYHVVDEADAAAGIDAPQRHGLALEDDQRPRPAQAGHALGDRGDACLDTGRQIVGRPLAADARAERADRDRDVGQAGVAVDVDGNLRALELRAQVRLAGVNHHEIRAQRQDPLDVGIDQRADSRQLLDLGRKPVEAADRHDLRARADREQHLGDGGDDRDDARRGARSLRGRLVALSVAVSP